MALVVLTHSTASEEFSSDILEHDLFLHTSSSVLAPAGASLPTQLLVPKSFLSWMVTSFCIQFLIIFSLFIDRLETANRQLSSRDYDGHEDKAAEGHYASQSESLHSLILELVFVNTGGLRQSCEHHTDFVPFIYFLCVSPLFFLLVNLTYNLTGHRGVLPERLGVYIPAMFFLVF